MARYDESQWPAYVSVAERRLKAERAAGKLCKKGSVLSPVTVEGRKIATTFWGKAWCDNLESYRDYENRLGRGRSYLRNGLVIDLQIAPHTVTAMVSGSSVYTVKITIAEVPKPQWKSICADCAGGIDLLVELLQGRFSKGVMERICRQGTGLFPKPAEIRFSCSCPDYASMCKHVAASLLGVGVRLDAKPELLFRLRGVDENDLVADIGSLPMGKQGPAAGKSAGSRRYGRAVWPGHGRRRGPGPSPYARRRPDRGREAGGTRKVAAPKPSAREATPAKKGSGARKGIAAPAMAASDEVFCGQEDGTTGERASECKLVALVPDCAAFRGEPPQDAGMGDSESGGSPGVRSEIPTAPHSVHRICTRLLPAGRYVLFSDIPNNRMMRLDEDDGHCNVFRQPSMNSNGNTIDREGRFITCEHSGRRVTRTEFDGSITIIADSYNGKKLNSPNDVDVASDGSIWFTDPAYGIGGYYEGVKAAPEQEKHNVFRADPKTGSLKVVVDDFVEPNGITFSPDEKKLYIIHTGFTDGPQNPSHIRVFDVDVENGKLSNSKVFVEMPKPSITDGMRADRDGRIWCSSAGAIRTRMACAATPPSGELLGKIHIPETVANLCFGGQQRNRLYICGSTSLYAVYTSVQGALKP